MNKLPKSMQVPLVLFDIEEFTHKEVAEILGISEGNVRVRIYRARRELKKILEQDCSFDRDKRNIFVCIPKENTPKLKSKVTVKMN